MSEELYGVLSPLLSAVGLDLVDVEVTRAEVRVFVDRPGGVDLDSLAEANRIVSAELDERDPFPGRYTLQVSSPGLERRLRTPAHFARAVGEQVSVRTLPNTTAVRRIQGELVASDERGFELAGPEVPDGAMRLAYDQVERAKTVFDWGAKPAPSPSSGKGHTKAPKAKNAKTQKTERVTTP